MDKPELWSLKDISRYLGVSYRPVYALLPNWPHVKLGGRILVESKHVKDWLRRELDAAESKHSRLVENVNRRIWDADDE